MIASFLRSSQRALSTLGSWEGTCAVGALVQGAVRGARIMPQKWSLKEPQMKTVLLVEVNNKSKSLVFLCCPKALLKVCFGRCTN